MNKDLKTIYIGYFVMNLIVIVFAPDFLWIWSFILVGFLILFFEVTLRMMREIDEEIAELKKK